jgi:hypothetical protein
MDEDDYEALLAYGGLFRMWTALASVNWVGQLDGSPTDDGCGDGNKKESPFSLVRRRDGQEMSEGDEDALLEFGGLYHLFTFFGDGQGAVGLYPEADENLTVGQCGTSAAFPGVERRDGFAMDEDDDCALMEFGGLLMLWTTLSSINWVGELDGSPTGYARSSSSSSSSSRPKSKSKSAFPMVRRRDGEAMTTADENALLEFGAFYYVLSFFGDGTGGIGPFFPEADENLTNVGVQWGQDQRRREEGSGPSSLLQRVDGKAMTEEDEEALLYYSAWASIGKLMITIKRRIFGESVASIVAESSAASSSKKKNAQAGPPMTRTPSGAELNAWIGLAAQNAFGLDKPDRKVRTRGVL